MAAVDASRRRALLLALGLVAAVVAVYAQVGDHAYLLYDDDEAITENAGLAQGLSLEGVAWAFRTTLVANWIPLTVLSLLADQELHGLSPRFVLLENVALHALATVVLFLAFRRMTGTLWRSAAVAAVFALHPLHVESVAWAAMRKDVVSGIFFALVLLAYAHATERPSVPRHGSVAAALALGLLSKPTLVATPFVLLLLDLWPLGRLGGADGSLEARRIGRAVLEKLPLFVLAAGACVMTMWTQAARGAVVAAQFLPPSQRAGNAVVAYADYVRTSVWPVDLAPLYPLAIGGLEPIRLLLSAVALLVVTVVCVRERRRRPWLLVGWLWFVGMLVPTIGLVQVGSQARADRYTYLPLIGLSILPVWSAAELAERGRAWRTSVAVASAAALAALAVTAHRQAGMWRDGVTLFSHTVAVTRDNALTRSYLGEALQVAGRSAEAAEQMRASLRLKPDYVEMMNNLAWLLATNPDVPPADPGEPLRLAKAAVDATGGRQPQALYTLALVLAREGRFPEAERTAYRAASWARALGAEPLALEIQARAAAFRKGRLE